MHRGPNDERNERERTYHGIACQVWDLSSTYKQIPLSDDAYHLDSYIVVYNPVTCKLEVYQQAVLPFASIASVTAFLRCAVAIWHVGSRMLKFTWTSYFDDFLSLTTAGLEPHRNVHIHFLPFVGLGAFE